MLLLDACPFASLTLQHQLSIINSFTVMSPDALPRRVLALHLPNHVADSLLHLWGHLLSSQSFSSISELLAYLLMAGIILSTAILPL